MFIRKFTIYERRTYCHRVYNYDNNIQLHCSLKGEELKTSHDSTKKKWDRNTGNGQKNRKTKKTKQGRTGVRALDKYSDCQRQTELTGIKNA